MESPPSSFRSRRSGALQLGKGYPEMRITGNLGLSPRINRATWTPETTGIVTSAINSSIVAALSRNVRIASSQFAAGRTACNLSSFSMIFNMTGSSSKAKIVILKTASPAVVCCFLPIAAELHSERGSWSDAPCLLSGTPPAARQNNQFGLLAFQSRESNIQNGAMQVLFRGSRWKTSSQPKRVCMFGNQLGDRLSAGDGNDSRQLGTQPFAVSILALSVLSGV
jgi:hypothetical protein